MRRSWSHGSQSERAQVQRNSKHVPKAGTEGAMSGKEAQVTAAEGARGEARGGGQSRAGTCPGLPWKVEAGLRFEPEPPGLQVLGFCQLCPADPSC